MGKLTIKRKFYLFVIGILLGVVALSVLALSSGSRVDKNELYGKCSVLLHNAIYQANQGDIGKLESYRYSVLDLRGNVLYSNDEEWPIGSKVDLGMVSGNSMGNNKKMEMTYSAPYLEGKVQKGIIYIYVPYSELEIPAYGRYVAVGIVCLYLMLVIWMFGKMVLQDVLAPMEQIHALTNRIRQGVLNEALDYDYDGEIGTLCHDFEALREELLFSMNNEKKLKEKEKLLLAYISHDLRTPIAIISCYVEGIHNQIVSGDRVHDYTTIILNKIAMLNQLIDEILEHSKAQLSELSIKKSEVYSDEYFGVLMEEAKKDVEKLGLTFTVNKIPKVILELDTQRMKQVMTNLIGNAMKFTTEGGITVSFELNNNKFYISVRDTGMGIAATDLPMIFDEFYRGEKARTLNVPGSGLGLSIVKYIVKEHQGQIECDSILGKWTEFRFYIPI
ncbi:MAG: HAMP domain-containing sensor histidine kinase [bacterium]|nr:HAMP domain-containing sensor histidine kinase [bacterium]